MEFPPHITINSGIQHPKQPVDDPYSDDFGKLAAFGKPAYGHIDGAVTQSVNDGTLARQF
jgi:hypothetical protein